MKNADPVIEHFQEVFVLSHLSLLSLLEAASGEFVSGEEISRQLGVSRTAVWKQIRKLEADGYTIEAVPRMGYRLVKRPSRLLRDEILPQLATKTFGKNLILLDKVASTQEHLRMLANEGAPEGTLVIAEQQTEGRGRMGRQWLSPPGKGIWMSLLLRPQIPLHQIPQLTLLAAVAMHRAITRVTNLEIGIKWPNDLLAGGKKISGILMESAAEEARVKYIIAGIGISVNLDEEDFPPEIRSKATSLKMAAGREIDRPELIAAVLGDFEKLYELYQQEGFSPIRTLWEMNAVTLGKEAVLATSKGTVEGVPISLDDTGGLRVQLADGQIQVFYSADVETKDSAKNN
jgi:BirA family biotin operon repressor/biotin-[acetyl-CoA-carboxylase] ligase